MLAIAEAGGHSPSLAEAGEGHHLPGLGDLEGTSLSQGLTACKRNKQIQVDHAFVFVMHSTYHTHSWYLGQSPT